MPGDLPEMIADGRLKEVPGIGDTMHAKIVQLATTGHLPSYDELRRSTPPGLVALLRIPGLGPKKIKALHDTLKIESLADLRAAGEAGKIAKLKGLARRRRPRSSRGSRLSRRPASGSCRAMRFGWSPRSSRRCATIRR